MNFNGKTLPRIYFRGKVYDSTLICFCSDCSSDQLKENYEAAGKALDIEDLVTIAQKHRYCVFPLLLFALN